MSETNTPPTPPPTAEGSETVSPETRSLVEQRLPEESDEIKQHLMALIDAIKQRAETQINSAEDITRDAYVSALRQAQDTLQKTGELFEEQRSTLERSLAGIEDVATQRWETLLSDIQAMGNRLDRAVNAAWQILTEPETSEAEATDADSKSSVD